MATPKSIAFQTLGCKLNYSETSTLAQQFRARGYHIAREDEPADIFVLNTCSVTEFADRKCRKAVRQALRRNPDARVVVTGCYAQLQPEEIAEIPGVDLVLGAGHKFRMLEYVEALGSAVDKAWVKAGGISDVGSFQHAHSFGDRTRSFLKVQDGCDYKCAFCTIPKARGISRSPKITGIVDRARQLQEQGVMEIVLTGVNIGDYGAHRPMDNETFLDLIRTLDQETDVPRYRISSIEPNLCTDAIIEFVAASPRFMPHFHMPLQSGSDHTLRRMRRRYRRKLYAQRVEKILHLMPDACIGVDVIVGFPGESTIDFSESLSFLQDMEVSYLHVFTYSERPDTPAAEMPDGVPMSERRERNAQLQLLSHAKRRAFYLRHLGQTRQVLLETPDSNGQLQGFTDNYIKVAVRKSGYTGNSLVNIPLQAYSDEDAAMLAGGETGDE